MYMIVTLEVVYDHVGKYRKLALCYSIQINLIEVLGIIQINLIEVFGSYNVYLHYTQISYTQL